MKKVIIIMSILMLLLILIVVYVNLKNPNEIIFSKTYYYAFGSEKIRIYEDGTVETDKEVEDPNHKTNFKKIKKLTAKEIKELKSTLEQNLSADDLKTYINELIHGDRNYDIIKSNFNF